MAINGVSGTSQTNGEFSLGSVTNSPQLQLALVMMKFSEINKNSAMDGIKAIESQQKKKADMADAINAARDLKSAGTVHGSATQEEYTSVIEGCKDYRDRKWAAVGSLKTFPEAHGITPAPYGDLNKAVQIWDKAIDQLEKLKTVNAACDEAGIGMPTSSDKDKNAAEWDKVIAQMQTKLDNMGSNIQTQMVQIQDWMGQYNSYLQGANTQITNSNQLLTTLARGQ